jgi:Skp family chaperone for outer membrane proteins
MKRGILKILLVALVVVGSATGQISVAQAQGKSAKDGALPVPVVGVIDNQAILMRSKAFASIREQRKVYSDKYKKDLDAEDKKLREESQKIEKQRSLVDAKAATKLREDFRVKIRAFEQRVAKARANMERANALAASEVQKRIILIAQDEAQKAGMNLVLQKNQVFLFDNAFSLTEAVLKRLDKELPKVQFPNPDKLPQQAAAQKK